MYCQPPEIYCHPLEMYCQPLEFYFHGDQRLWITSQRSGMPRVDWGIGRMGPEAVSHGVLPYCLFMYVNIVC